jgi:activating signal cointegrator 1
MKALSLFPIWAWAVCYAGKLLENRAWSSAPEYRGPLLLHASLGKRGSAGRTQYASAAMWMQQRRLAIPAGSIRLREEPDALVIPTPATLARGSLVARCRLDGILRTKADFAAYAANVPGGEAQRVWWDGGLAFVLADVEPLPEPIPWKGLQRIFNVPDDVLTRAVQRPEDRT